MNALVVLGDGLDVGVPAILSSHLLNSFLLACHLAKALGECLVSGLSERSTAFFSWRDPGHLVPLLVILSQEWDGIRKLLSFHIFSINLVFIGDISIKNKWGSVNRCLESALGRSHRRAILGPILD